MVCGNFILPEPASYVFFYAFSNLRKLLYLIRQTGHCLESGLLHPPQAALRRFPRRPLQKEQDHPLGGLVLFGANEIEWRETNSGFRTPQRGVETGSNSPVDCCVSENRASQKVAPRWGGFLIYSGTFWCPRACRSQRLCRCSFHLNLRRTFFCVALWRFLARVRIRSLSKSHPSMGE